MLEDLTLRKAVEFAVRTEELGAGFYGRLAKKFKDSKEMKEVFTQLAKDEVVHGQRFAELRDKLPEESEPVQFEQAQYLRAIALSDIYSGDEGPMKNLAALKTTEDALARAFNLEKTTLLYYEGMKGLLGESEILNAIIEEEKRHVVKVMQYMITGAKMRGLDDQHP